MTPLAKKIQWVIHLIIEEQPRKLVWRDIAKSTGFPPNDVEDAIHDLWRRGILDVRPDATLEIL